MAVEEDTGLAEEASCRCAVAEAAETPDVKRQDLEADQSTTYHSATRPFRSLFRPSQRHSSSGVVKIRPKPRNEQHQAALVVC